MRYLILVPLVFVFTVGCQQQPTDLRPALVCDLARHGVHDQNTSRIVIMGSEGGYGDDIRVEAVEGFIIQKIWDCIYQSRPYDTWFASGYRRIEFYTPGDREKPSAILYVNASGACHIYADGKRYRCPALDDYLTPHIKKAWEKKRKLSKPQR